MIIPTSEILSALERCLKQAREVQVAVALEPAASEAARHAACIEAAMGVVREHDEMVAKRDRLAALVERTASFLSTLNSSVGEDLENELRQALAAARGEG